MGGECLSQFHPQGLPQDALSRVIHLVGWALPLRPEISPSLHHSWVRPVTPHHVTSSRTGPGTLPAYQPFSPWVTHSGPDISGRTQLGRRKSTLVLGKKCVPTSSPHPVLSPTSVLSRLGFHCTRWHGLARLSPSCHVVLCPSGTDIPREASGLAARAEGLAVIPTPHHTQTHTQMYRSHLFFWSQGQLFGDGKEMWMHIHLHCGLAV